MYVIWAIHFAHMGTIARGWFAADDDTKRIGKILPEAFLLGKKQSTAYILQRKDITIQRGTHVAWFGDIGTKREPS